MRAFGHSKRALTNSQTGTVWGRKQELPAPHHAACASTRRQQMKRKC